MCMRSDKTGYAPQLGVFLRDLEDKMEVARVQELILEEITNLRDQISNSNEAIAALNSGLYEISQVKIKKDSLQLMTICDFKSFTKTLPNRSIFWSVNWP